jgi:hypothetical protein
LVDGEFKIIGSSGVIEFNWFIDYSACFLMMVFFRKMEIKCKRSKKNFFVVFERIAILRKEKQINERQEFEQNALYLS